MTTKSIFLTLTLSFLFVPTVHAKNPICSDPNFERETVDSPRIPPRKAPHPSPIKPKLESLKMSLGGKKVTVKYERYPATGNAKGTVISLCGGPGLPCVTEGRPASIPPDMDVIVFDYAGIGQNQRLNGGEQMSIESQAKIVEAIVKERNLKDYMLYGSSFGTAVATVAAADLSQDASAMKPKMVVIEGVVGNMSCNYKLKDAFTRTADRAWSLLSPSEKVAFQKGYDRMIKAKGNKSHRWLDERIFDGIKFGPKEAAKMLKGVAAGHVPPKPVEEIDGPIGSHEYRSAGCQQSLAHPPLIRDKYFGGRVAYTDNDDSGDPTTCDCPLVNRTYDPKNFQISKVPVLYIGSQTDVSTPIECAHYHLSNQNQTDDKLLLIPADVPHADLDYGLKACGPIIWNAALAGNLADIKSNSATIESASCGTTGVQTATAGQSSSSSR